MKKLNLFLLFIVSVVIFTACEDSLVNNSQIINQNNPPPDSLIMLWDKADPFMTSFSGDNEIKYTDSSGSGPGPVDITRRFYFKNKLFHTYSWNAMNGGAPVTTIGILNLSGNDYKLLAIKSNYHNTGGYPANWWFINNGHIYLMPSVVIDTRNPGQAKITKSKNYIFFDIVSENFRSYAWMDPRLGLNSFMFYKYVCSLDSCKWVKN